MMCCADAPEMAELGLIAPLGNILSQLSQGGGAKGINIEAVSPSSSVHAMPLMPSSLTFTGSMHQVVLWYPVGM